MVIPDDRHSPANTVTVYEVTGLGFQDLDNDSMFAVVVSGPDDVDVVAETNLCGRFASRFGVPTFKLSSENIDDALAFSARLQVFLFRIP